MAKIQKPDTVSGVLIVNKHAGVTSHRIISACRVNHTHSKVLAEEETSAFFSHSHYLLQYLASQILSAFNQIYKIYEQASK